MRAGLRELGGDPRQAAGDRVVARVQRVLTLPADVRQLLRVPLDLAFLLQLRLLARCELRLAQLLHLKAQQLEALARGVAAGRQRRQPVGGRAERLHTLPPSAARGAVELAEQVEQLEMALRLQQQRVLELAVDVDQPACPAG